MDAVSPMIRFEAIYRVARTDKWFQRFAVFCRIAMAATFIPTSYVKIIGERFIDLPSNNPLGHYLDALHLTGYYYIFIGVAQLIIAVLLFLPGILPKDKQSPKYHFELIV